MSAAVPVESGRVDHEAIAAEHQWEINGYCVVEGGNFRFAIPLVIPVSQIPLRRDGAVDSDRLHAMIQLHIDAMAAQEQVDGSS